MPQLLFDTFGMKSELLDDLMLDDESSLDGFDVDDGFDLTDDVDADDALDVEDDFSDAFDLLDGELAFGDDADFQDAPQRILDDRAVVRAARANRRHARTLGWGRLTAGGFDLIPPLATALGLPAVATEAAFAEAVAVRQRALRMRPTGQLDPGTWRRLAILPAPRFRPFRVTVRHGGRVLGLWEKVAPYQRVVTPARMGVSIQLGFRVTDPDAVRTSRFVLPSGDPNFRIIQVVNALRGVQTVAGRIAHARIVDPSALFPQPPGSIVDPHPYYEDGEPGDGTASTFHIDAFRNRIGPNGLFYDLLFEDRPQVARVIDPPVGRRIRAFETAIVGVQQGRRNVVLNTLRWGYDVITRGGVVQLSEGGIHAGPTGGSPLFRSVLARATQAGDFPGHCLVGSAFPRAVRCA